MYRQKSLSLLRSFMEKNGTDVIIIPSNDCHFGEYVPDYFKARAWLSGFDGSAGTIVVTTKSSALWTDSRYFIQAENQLAGSEIELMKLKMEGTPSIPQWIFSQYPDGCTVAVDGNLFSYSEYCNLKKELFHANLVTIDDPFKDIWHNRPELKSNSIYLLKEKLSGESTLSKYRRIVEKLGIKGRFAHIVSTCDDIMWLCNIRGSDIEYNPVALSYCIISENGITLFCNKNVLTEDASEYLKKQNVVIREYGYFREYLENLDISVTRIVSEDKISVANYFAVCRQGSVRKDDPTVGGTIPMLKCRKNAVEIEGFRKAFVNDGIAWCKLLKYIYDNLDSGKLNEYLIAEKFAEFRSFSPDYCGESFEPIVAFNANAAAAHYSIKNEEDAAQIERRGFLLMDTGAHYPYGTTDTTRTIALSTLSYNQKQDYTLVLKGMINLATAVFPKNTRGSQLDILARGPMYRTGKMYFHGTGHGIGHHLCVHESPQIRFEENSITLDTGMVMSDEPAVYIDGQYGIRIENVITIVPYMETEINSFFKFETMTLVPIDTTGVDKKLLSQEEIEWLNNYNKHVYKTLLPYLTEEESAWLDNITCPI